MVPGGGGGGMGGGGGGERGKETRAVGMAGIGVEGGGRV